MTPLFSSTIKVDCPDGPRYILKYPEKAFAITFPDWDVRVNALVKFFSGAEAKTDSKIFRKAKSIVKNLTENYAALQAHYQAAYLGWCGNPCSKEAEKTYNDAKAMICKKEFALKKLESRTLELASQIKTQLKTKPKAPVLLKAAKKKEGKKRVREGAEEGLEYWDWRSKQEDMLTEGRIPVPEAVFDNIQELVSKLKI
jgi:hypothetical protein